MLPTAFRGSRYGRSVAERDDDARVDRGDSFDQPHLLGRQLDGRAITSFSLVRGGKAEEEQHQLARLRDGDRILTQAGRILVRVQGVAGRKGYRRRLSDARLQSVQSAHDAGRIHRRTACTLIPRRTSELSDYSDRAHVRRVDRKQRSIVVQQDRRLGGGPARQLVMRIEVNDRPRLPGFFGTTGQQT